MPSAFAESLQTEIEAQLQSEWKILEKASEKIDLKMPSETERTAELADSQIENLDYLFKNTRKKIGPVSDRVKIRAAARKRKRSREALLDSDTNDDAVDDLDLNLFEANQNLKRAPAKRRSRK